MKYHFQILFLIISFALVKYAEAQSNFQTSNILNLLLNNTLSTGVTPTVKANIQLPYVCNGRTTGIKYVRLNFISRVIPPMYVCTSTPEVTEWLLKSK